MGPGSLRAPAGAAPAGFRTLKPLTGPPMPVPGGGRSRAVRVGALVNPASGLLGLLLVGDGTLLLLPEAGDVSSRAFGGTAIVVLARSMFVEGIGSIFVSNPSC